MNGDAFAELNAEADRFRPVVKRRPPRKHEGTKYPYKGISKVSPAGRVSAAITHDGKRLNLGTYDTIEDAALAYNAAALRLYGEKATLNEVARRAGLL